MASFDMSRTACLNPFRQNLKFHRYLGMLTTTYIDPEHDRKGKAPL